MKTRFVFTLLFSTIVLSKISLGWASKLAEPALTGTITSKFTGDEIGIDGHIYKISSKRMCMPNPKQLTVGKQVEVNFDYSPNDERASIISVAPHNSK